jgi:hypothetical protein
MYPALSASAVWRRHLYVGGYFEAAGDKVSHAIARWDGVALTALLPPPMLAVSPNPARTSAVISYLLEDPGPVTIDVYDVQGRKVARVLSEDQLGGPQTATWDLRESRGRRVTAGAYFVRLRTRAGSSGSRLMVMGRE